MLVFGGAGRLYGALVGAAVFIVAQDALAGISPDYWQFWLGAVLVVLVLIARGGLLGALDALRPARARGGADVASALQTRDLRRRFGAFTAVDGVSLDIEAGARHAIIGPNGAGKTTLINLITGTLRPDGGDVILGGERVTGVAPHARVKRGLARTFQINTLFPQLTVAESVALAIGERRGHGRDWLASGGGAARGARRGARAAADRCSSQATRR